LKLALKLLCILLCGIILGYVLLLGVFTLPIAPMAENVRASVPALNGEWGHEGSYEQLIPGYTGTQLDNSTDAAMLLHAVHESDLPITTRVAEGFRYISEGNAFKTLLLYGESNPDEMLSSPISRYWHGYLVFLKPLLLVLSYLDIRMLLTIVQGGMLAAVIAGLCKRNQERLILPFLLSMLCVTPSITGMSMQFSTALCTFLLALVLLLWLPRRFFEGHGLPVLFLLTGMMTSYVDYLTYPLVTFGMPMVLALFLYPEKDDLAEWKRFILLGVCWGVGYFGMWAGKWMFAWIFGNEKWFWPNLLASITERSSNVSAETTLRYTDVLRSVCGVFFKRAYLLAGVAAAAAWLICLLRTRKNPSESCLGRRTVLIACALLPFIWFFFTQNHTYNHAFYTSRTLAVAVFALSAFMGTFIHPAKR